MTGVQTCALPIYEQLLEYAKDCFYDDVMTLMNNNELWECIDVTMMEFDDV